MKKTYISPLLDITELEGPELLLAESVTTPNKPISPGGGGNGDDDGDEAVDYVRGMANYNVWDEEW